jgi:hypothetical protein
MSGAIRAPVFARAVHRGGTPIVGLKNEFRRVAQTPEPHMRRPPKSPAAFGWARLAIGLPTLRRVALVFAMVVAGLTLLATRGNADPTIRGVGGDVRARVNGAPIPGAVVTLDVPGGANIVSTKSDRNGAFTLAAPSAGRYQITVVARGYRPVSTPLAIAAGESGPIKVLLMRDDALHEIGGVVAHSSARPSASADQSVSHESLASAGALRVADVLQQISGVDVSGDALSPGGDAYVSLRGLRPGESQTLLDGHPIGPTGIQSTGADSDGTIAGFNYQDAPYFALRDVDVALGAGGAGLGVSDAIGGTVNLRTFEPTEHPEAVAQQGFGTQGRTFTTLRATGTQDKLGYVLVHGVEGTFGLFPGGAIVQTGLRGTDFTSQTLEQLTYPVSGDYVLRNELAKFVYAPMPSTKIALTAYDATSWADKTGEGDNDYNPYAYTLANAPVGASASCPHGVLVTTDSGPSCISPGAYAAGASGPAGGGPGAWQALRNQDYDAHLTSEIGKSALTADAFTDEYALLYHRDASQVNGPLDAFLDRWSTQGLRLSDEFTGPTNALGFGVSWLRQTLSGDATTPDGSALVASTPVGRIEQSAFVREIFSPNLRLSLLFSAWLKRASDDPSTHLDPRLSITYRLTKNDAFRLTGARSTDEPGLQASRVDLLPVGALNPDCGAMSWENAVYAAFEHKRWRLHMSGFKRKFKSLRKDAGKFVRRRIEKRTHSGGARISAVAKLLRSSAGDVRSRDSSFERDVVEAIAQRLDAVGHYLKVSDTDRLLADAESLARRVPLTFTVTGFLLGFLTGRFLRASRDS